MATSTAYLGLDIGGTGVKAGVFSRDGKMLASSRRAFEPTISADGHVDISIDIIYKSAQEAVHEAAKKSRTKILAMSISSQGETFVTLDNNARPLHDAILWYDSRAGRQAEELREAVRSATGRIPSIDAILSVSKIRWLQENHPEIMRKARRFFLLPDYIAYRLTGIAAFDINTAASTGLLTSAGDKYDPAILKAAGIDFAQLSNILVPGTPIGKILKPMAKEWGLTPATILVSGTNDQYAGAIGAGNYRPGILTETSGTCLALVTLTKRLPKPMPRGLFGGCFPIKPYYFMLAYVKTAGVVLDWFRKECAGGASFDVLNAEAAAVPIGCRGLTMLPHFDGMVSPTPNAAMRGRFCGLTLKHTRADLYRSILEALTFSLKENMEWMRQHGLAIETVRGIGGGAKNEFWLQMKADVTGQPVEQPAVTESAVLGAAMLAAWGAGAFFSLSETSAAWYHIGRLFIPKQVNHDRYKAPYRRYRELTKG
ncbi:MAG: FGGY family carbohydrate kinase [Kiritimatiellae bacterium]|nr:FGGY family carbohydrate kinase [Kiritimatiellia bacterium]